MNPSTRSTVLRLQSALAAVALASLAAQPRAAELLYAKDGSGVCGYKDTPVLPWCGFHVHDPDRPAPKRVVPGANDLGLKPPSDAIVLFDGSGLSQFEPTQWKVVDGCIEATDGDLTTRQQFGSYQLHVEWRTPNPPEGELFNRGNNGVFLLGLYEIQIFDSDTVRLYPDGQAAAVYGQTPPLVNACRKPGEWQSYDIFFTAPKFDGARLIEPARVTMLHNGLLVHLNTEIRGETGHRILPEYKVKVSRGPLKFNGHHNPVRFRNLWLRPLD
jgi:hypothetical protein